jgi:sialate O-acetylesterase
MVASWDQKAATYDPAKAKATYEKQMADWKVASEAAKKAGKKAPNPPRMDQGPEKNPNGPAVLYNGMIAPIVGYANKGTIWYQGESNAGRAYQYRKLLPTMIQSWRDAWGATGAATDTKFLIVQLANFQNPATVPGDDAWAELREAQTMTAALPNNGIAVAIDLADADNPGDIHPKNKQDVGKRLALVALGKYYGKADVKYAGPTYKAMKVEGNKVRISYTDAEGLTAQGGDGKVKGFAVAGADKAWKWADAKIEGNDVVAWNDQVPAPVAVRYAWSTNPVTNLYNAAGLPAAPFRTDDWPGVTAPKPPAAPAKTATK